MSFPSEDEQQRVIESVLRQRRVLPPRDMWENWDRRPYVDQLPDILEGLLRQFSTRLLDLGRLGIDDDARYRVYRSAVFDVRDTLQQQLRDWLLFLQITDKLGRTAPAVREALV